MEPERRRQVMVGGLVVVIASAAVYLAWPRPPAAAARPSSNVRSAGAKAGAKAVAAPDVHLEALSADRPRPDTERDLFRFRPKPPPPAPPRPAVVPSAPVAPPAPVVPTGPPPPPDIALKFAGIIAQGPVKIAVLIDPLGHSIYGKEGETIEGRYKIWRIGVESLEISYLDGRGRKTIRMSGT